MQIDYHFDCVSVGERLRKIRKAKGLSQEELSMKLGCDAKYLSRLENGKANPSLQLMMKFSDITNATLDFLLYGYHPIYRPEEKKVREPETKYEPTSFPLSQHDYKIVERLLAIISDIVDQNIN